MKVDLTKSEVDLVLRLLQTDIECNADVLEGDTGYAVEERIAWAREAIDELNIVRKLKAK